MNLRRPVFFLCLGSIVIAIEEAWTHITRLQAILDIVLAALYAVAVFPFTGAELRYYWQRAKQLAREIFTILALAVLVVGWASLLIALAGCAARRPYNDTCGGYQLCKTVPRVPPRRPTPAPPKPPRRAVYKLSFDRPRPDCFELERKPDTSIRLWACAPPEVPHER